MGNRNKLKLWAAYQDTGKCPYQDHKQRPRPEAHSLDEQKRHGHIRASQDLPEEEADAFPTPCRFAWTIGRQEVVVQAVNAVSTTAFMTATLPIAWRGMLHQHSRKLSSAARVALGEQTTGQ